MRVLVCCLFVMATSTALAPNSAELRNRYGTPDAEHRNADGGLDSEDFAMRRGASLTAHYGSDGRACQIEILPTLDLEQTVQRSFLSDEIVSEALEGFAPVAMRGKEFGEGHKNSVLVTEYENVLVMQKQAFGGGVSDMTISFKREACPKPLNPFVFLPPPDPATLLRLTPTSAELRKRFGVGNSGAPFSDVFSVQPDIRLSVKYGSDHHACSIEIEPADASNLYMPRQEVSQLVDEFAPVIMRGREIAGYGEFRSSCVGVGMVGYENVFIGRWPNYCVPEHPNTDMRAIIQFKRDVCPNPYISEKTRETKSQ
jgi:hypothetical protein